jgi:hypothetical protein
LDDQDLEDQDLDDQDEEEVTLSSLRLRAKSKFEYEYDFGDGWIHQILVESVSARDPSSSYPQCVAGERACPPEDCGGIFGYDLRLSILGDPDHPEHEEIVGWFGDGFDPAMFDVNAADKRLRFFR